MFLRRVYQETLCPPALAFAVVAALATLLLAGTTGCKRAQADGQLPRSARSPAALVPATADEIIRHVADGEATVHILNFWATWCAPCLAELPDFVALADRYQPTEVQIDFVSVDMPEDSARAVAFLERVGWDEASFLKVGKDHEFVAAFESPWTGAVPATLVYRGGVLDHFIGGMTNFESLAAVINESLAVR